MDLRAYATTMAHYNAWMNGNLYEKAAALSDEQRKRDLGAFFKSLHGTFNHLLIGDIAWMQRFRGEPLTMRSPRDELHADFEALRAARRAMDADILAWAQQLDPALGATQFRFWSVAYQKERLMPYGAAVAHMFNHQTHHRGQATTLLMQLGVDPGVTDLPWMPYFD
ncbi:MAG: damage-inducible protein DinB [Nevskiaceae bacterium]|nr:MAG: damage-inducible protein DinB [Nevskiaceae bacterium]